MANGVVATTNWAPTAKVGAGALAGAATTLIVGLLKGNHPSVFGDAGVVAAITSVLTFIIQYLVPERS